MNLKFLICFVLLFGVIFCSCSEIKTENPKECYKYWAGTSAPIDVKVLNGKYWQSPHWTKEYFVFLHLKSTKRWLKEFVKQNSLEMDSTAWSEPNDIPEWFKPKNDFQSWNIGDDFNSRYFIDTSFHEMFMYEVQL